VTADGYDSVATPSGGEDASTRRVSFMKDAYGYRLEVSGGSRALTEERVSRLVCRVADRGLALDVLSSDGAVLAHPWEADPNYGVGEPNWNDAGDSSAFTKPYDPNGAVDPQYNAPPVSVSDAPGTYVCPDCGDTYVSGTAHHCASGTHTCPICGEVLPIDVEHSHAATICPDCGESYAAGAEHHCTGGTYICSTCGQTVQNGAAHSHGEEHHDDHHGGHH
ncbi:MAG: hypothetical protein K2M15_03625, partial [Oscillospiraceae bacterium]|nr:hypothetical protein [Oscillospiraceae bacterium]